MLRTLVLSALGVTLVGATLVVGVNSNVSSIAGEQEEVDIAMNPKDANHLIGGSNDSTRGSPLARLYETSNGGQSWTKSQLALPSGFNFSADPALTFDRNGNAYYALIVYNNQLQLSLYVTKKAAGATSWGPSVLVPNTMADKEFIVADTDPASACVDNVYVAWDNNEQGGQTLRVSRSTNGGTSFQAPPQVSDYIGAAIGAYPAVGPGGVVYVAWSDWQNHRILLDKSTDCGQTWGTDKVVHTWTLPTGASLSYKPPSNPQRGAGVFPYLAVDLSGGPRRGRLYMLYNDLSTSPGGNADIFMRYSDNQGSTWSSPVRVNDDTGSGDQYMPRVSVDNTDGAVHVIWYDTRNDPNRRKTDLYYARSVDGQTFLPNEKVTTSMSDKSSSGHMGYGEYVGIAAGKGKAFLFWTDNRSNDDEVYGAEVLSVLGIAASVLPKAFVQQPYSTTLVGGGGTPPYRWSVTGLPASLTLTPSSGQVSGTPGTADVGNHALNVTLTDATNASVSRTVTLEVAYPPLVIGTAQLPAGRVGQPYSLQLAGGGGRGPYTWSATGLPSSLTVSAPGLLAGTPAETDAGARNVQLTLTDSSGATTSKTLTLLISGLPMSITPPTLPKAQERLAFGPVPLGKSGGTPPFTWSWATGYVPPPGLQLFSSGTLGGTPAMGSAGDHSLRISVRDSSVPAAQSASITVPLVVFGQPIADPGPDRTVDPGELVLDGTLSRDPAGNSLEYEWTPPAGVSLSAPTSARPTTTVTRPGDYPFTLSVKSSAGARSEPKAAKLTVRNSPPVVQIQPVAPVQLGAQVLLDASGTSDPNGDAVALYWFQVSGPTTRLSTLSGPQTTFAAQEPGAHTFQVSASDGTSTVTGNVEVLVQVATEQPSGCGCAAGKGSGLGLLAALGSLVGLWARGRGRRR